MNEIKELDDVSTSTSSTELSFSQEWDPTPNTSPLQISTSDDDNQSMSGSRDEMVGEHKEIETKTPVSEIQEFQKIDRKREITEVNFPVISSPNMTERTDETEANNIGNSDAQNIEEIGKQRTPLSEEAAIKNHKPNEVTRASTDIRTRLEECKHLADLDDSQISLLVEAISAYPHLWKACEKFSDRFQALMLRTLSDMLLFLRSESVGSVNPEREKEFLKLCDVAVQLGFEKSWVDEMCQRVVRRDPKFDHARARIGDLLKRHAHLTQELHNLTKELHNMKIELMSLHDYFDIPSKCFDFL
ncbi:hypothetical protein V8G54_036710 [Vigna mungo]|uniref:Uncharacterized protein n=1 Tax=Vigna mungo TaxID=3915 RepID=A0AAQ3REQ7_VIGMU